MIDDIDRIMAVMATAFDPQWGEAWNRKQVEDSLALPNTHYALVDSKGMKPEGELPAAGFTLVRAAPGEEELLLIGVDPVHRGKGLGAKLLAQFIENARSRGAETVFLEMRANNPAAALYKSFHFSPIGLRKEYYKTSSGKRIDAITFGRRTDKI